MIEITVKSVAQGMAARFVNAPKRWQEFREAAAEYIRAEKQGDRK